MGNKIEIKGFKIHIDNDYVSLTDIVKSQRENDKPNLVIRDWLKNLNTLDFLHEWELMHNDKFKGGQMDTFKLELIRNGSKVTASKWIKETYAIGIKSKAGRTGGGIFAHKDIAMNFCYWINPRFQVWFIKKFQELAEAAKENENFYLEKMMYNNQENLMLNQMMIEERKKLKK